jgi:poly(3-hydroxyalkanoate) synthetase
MFLLEPRRSAASARPVVIVGPYAVHDAAIADFAEGHSLAGVLTEEGAGPLALTFWKSATVQMRDYGIDAYLSDLNVAVDDLGGRVSLVGICQGGWLAAAYAARFPRKVAKLVAAAAPLDPSAAESHITRTLAATPPAAIARALALTGGRVSGTMSSALFGDNWSPEFNAEAALQGADVSTVQKFDVWNSRTVDLPGVYFAQTAEWIFRENRLANGSFPALGREVGLAEIVAPIFVLAASDDAVVTPPQATARQVEMPPSEGRRPRRARAAPVAVHGPPHAQNRLAGHRALARRRARCKRKSSERGGVKEHGVTPDGPRTLIRGKRPIWNSALIATCCGRAEAPAIASARDQDRSCPGGLPPHRALPRHR